jgi:hypothetical protein
MYVSACQAIIRSYIALMLLCNLGRKIHSLSSVLFVIHYNYCEHLVTLHNKTIRINLIYSAHHQENIDLLKNTDSPDDDHVFPIVASSAMFHLTPSSIRFTLPNFFKLNQGRNKYTLSADTDCVNPNWHLDLTWCIISYTGPSWPFSFNQVWSDLCLHKKKRPTNKVGS